ncbi:MAG: TrkH family potassium uptake protein [Bacteroidales bacterium]|nr:TrkH family potassium uptake protein [Bacteroidales bacterium]
MNVKAISLNVGKALLVSALFMFLSIVVSVINGFDSAFSPLLISFMVTLIVGAFPFIFVRKAQPLSLRDGYLTIVLSWLLSFIFGMLPYVLWGGEFTLVNAWFESVSGYTTTGATILNDVEVLPDSLLFWRSSTHYIGGLGVVVFLLLVMPDASPYRLKLTNMELSSLSKEGYRYKSTKVVWVITRVYVGLTLLSFIALWAGGMSFFDALNHSFSIVSTGGFSTRNLSIAYYDSVLIDVIVMVFMAVSAMHFGLIYSMFATRSFKPLNNTVVKYYFSSMIVLSIVSAIGLMRAGGYDSWGNAFLDASFNVVSYMSTTGFANCDNSQWPWIISFILIFASLQCGCSGSTAGGIKADRLVISMKAIVNEVKHRLHPSSVSHVRLGGQLLTEKTVTDVMMYVVIYMLVILVSIACVMLCGVDVSDAVSGVIASVGSVGPGVAELGSLCNYSSQPAAAKLIWSFDMFLGRLEIYPIFIVISMLFNKGR